MRIDNASNIVFENLVFEASRNNLININKSSNIKFSDCVFRYAGNKALLVQNSNQINVLSCSFYETGLEAIDLSGGNRANLTKANNHIINTSISRTSRQVTTTSAVEISGVGNVFRNNVIFDTPHTAIRFRGNDNIISFNEIYNVCFDTADSGAIYSGRDFTFGGNIIEYNYIHNMQSNFDGTLGPSAMGMGTSAIYLDDQVSGITIKGNLMVNVFRGILLGGGKSNIIENNIFVDSAITITADNRGESWASVSNGATMQNRLFSQSLDIRNSELWKSRYPYLAVLINDYDSNNYNSINAPSDNIIRFNIKCNTPLDVIHPSVISNGIYKSTKQYNKNIIFVDANNKNFNINPSFAEEGDYQFPFNKIGILS